MGWQDQGRPYHMRFGHGTAPDAGDSTDSSAIGKSTADRVLALAYGALASLPAAHRRQAEAQYDNGTLPRLKEAMTAWLRATALDQEAFASRLFGRNADAPIAQSLHSAALRAATATSHNNLREAAGKLARAMEMIGIQQWPRFVSDAQERARDPATQAAIEKSRLPPAPGRDAIRPVYPIETMAGIGAAGVLGGVAAALRAAGGAAFRQILPGSRSPSSSAPAEGGAAANKPSSPPVPAPKKSGSDTAANPVAAEKPPISRQKQDSHIVGTPQNRNRVKLGKPTSTFDGPFAEADALTQEAWQKGTPVPNRPGVRDYDLGRRIGTGGYGGSQSSVRVYQDSAGRIHGHPVGREIP